LFLCVQKDPSDYFYVGPLYLNKKLAMIYYRRSHVKCMKLTNVSLHTFLYKPHIPGVGKIRQNTTADLPVCCEHKSRHIC
jgi:hypothetical protein